MEKVIFDGSKITDFDNLWEISSEEFTVDKPVLVTAEGLNEKSYGVVFLLEAIEPFEYEGEPSLKQYYFPCTQCQNSSYAVLPKGLYASNPSFYIDAPKNTSLRFVPVMLAYGGWIYISSYDFDTEALRRFTKDVKITIREVEDVHINNLYDLGCPDACPELATVPIEEHTVLYDGTGSPSVEESYCFEDGKVVSKIEYDSVTGDVLSVEYDDSQQVEKAYEYAQLINIPIQFVDEEYVYDPFERHVKAINDECISEPPCFINDIAIEAKEPDPVPPDVTETTTPAFCTGGYSEKAYKAGMVAVKMDVFDDAYVDTLDDLDPSLLTIEVPISVVKKCKYWGNNFRALGADDEEITIQGVSWNIDEQGKAYLMPFFTNASDMTLHPFVINHKAYLPFFKNMISRYNDAYTISQFEEYPDVAYAFINKHLTDAMLVDTQVVGEANPFLSTWFIEVYRYLYENYNGFTVDFTPIPPVEYGSELHSFVETSGLHALIMLLAIPMADGRHLLMPVPMDSYLKRFIDEYGGVEYSRFYVPKELFEVFENYIMSLQDAANAGDPYAMAMLTWWRSNVEQKVLPPICLVSAGDR